jgi:hypothetical protein
MNQLAACLTLMFLAVALGYRRPAPARKRINRRW